VRNRNVFQKIYDEIKYLYKIATTGSKEKRQLEEVKRKFERAYREGGKTAENAKTDGSTASDDLRLTGDGDIRYSLSATTDGKSVAIVDNDILSNIDTDSWDDSKKDTAKKAASDALKKFKDGIVVNGITNKVNRISRKEYTRSNYSEALYKHAPDIFADKMRAADAVDDIVVAAANWKRDGNLKHQRNDHIIDFERGETLIMSGSNKYSAEVLVGITDKREAIFYDVVSITPTDFDIKTKEEESPTTATTQNAIGDIHEDSSADSIPQTPPNVNSKKSLSSENLKNSSKKRVGACGEQITVTR